MKVRVVGVLQRAATGTGGAISRVLAFGRPYVVFLGAGLLLAPAAAQELGVVFDCPKKECHIAPVTVAGGFVGEVAEADSKVSFAVTCGRSLTALEIEPDDDGGVRVLFSQDNGLACAEDGWAEIRGLADGGWYWIVEYGLALPAPLVAKDTIRNPAVKPWNPNSPNIDFHPLENAYATLVFDAVSGSAGILPHLVSLPRTPPPPACLPEEPEEEGDDWGQPAADCLLGDGQTAIAFRYGNTFRAPGAGSVTVTRPVTGQTRVIASLWGDGSGHISIADPVDPRHGHYLPEATAFPASSWSMAPLGTRPGEPLGLTQSGREITVVADRRFCDSTSRPPVNHTVRVRVSAAVADPAAIEVLPRVKVDANFVAAERTLTVRCPKATANMGTDLLTGPPTAGPRGR